MNITGSDGASVRGISPPEEQYLWARTGAAIARYEKRMADDDKIQAERREFEQRMEGRRRYGRLPPPDRQ